MYLKVINNKILIIQDNPSIIIKIFNPIKKTKTKFKVFLTWISINIKLYSIYNTPTKMQAKIHSIIPSDSCFLFLPISNDFEGNVLLIKSNLVAPLIIDTYTKITTLSISD